MSQGCYSRTTSRYYSNTVSVLHDDLEFYQRGNETERFWSRRYQATMTTPSSPPPPYQSVPPTVYNNVTFEQPSMSQIDLSSSQPKTLRKKRSAWLSPCDSNNGRVNEGSKQGRGWHSTTRLVESGQAGDGCRPLVRAAACLDTVADRLHDVLSRVDGAGRRDDGLESLTHELSLEGPRYAIASGVKERSDMERRRRDRTRSGIINIQKSWMYANSRLPPHLLPYKVYLQTWQVYCKAAEASSSVYQRPKTGEREDYIEANWRLGTKAMALKSVVQDRDKLIVIAIRGSQWNVIDWAVNFTVDPAIPSGFLDDDNPCHEGFLEVARSMVGPVAEHLRQLVEQDPSRHTCSLLFTGHSAGGAVANLLYLHMLSQTVESELTVFNGIFKRVHCVTFGVPPMALLPLQNPAGHRYRKNQFVSFVNEGDPIARADFAYMRSLAHLYAASTPELTSPPPVQGLRQKMSRQALRASPSPAVKTSAPPTWPVPDAVLSNAGRLVLLREKPGHRTKVEAACTSDEQLRGVVFGDPVMHHMDVYERRIQNLAIASVTGKEIG